MLRDSGVTAAGCGPVTSLKGDLKMDNARVKFSEQGTIASSDIELDASFSVYRVTSDGQNTQNGLTMPSGGGGGPGPAPVNGQMLLIENAVSQPSVQASDLTPAALAYTPTVYYTIQ